MNYPKLRTHFRFAEANGVQLLLAHDPKQRELVGIHLLQPTERELEDAIGRAIADQFPRVVVHSPKTWERNL